MKIEIGETLNLTYELNFKITWLQADEFHEQWIENSILVEQLKEVITNFMFEKKILTKNGFEKHLEELIEETLKHSNSNN